MNQIFDQEYRNVYEMGNSKTVFEEHNTEFFVNNIYSFEALKITEMGFHDYF